MATKTKSKSGLMAKFSKLSSVKRASIFALIFGAIAAAIIFSSSAASITHSYNWDTGNGGKGWHISGHHNVLDGALIPCSTEGCGIHVWAIYQTDMPSSGSAASMWYGPYDDIPGHNHILRTCWKYFGGTTKSSTVVFDVIYTNSSGHHTLYSSGNRNIPAGALVAGLLQSRVLCHDTQLDARDIYNNVEIRVRPVSIGSGFNNGFRMWKTAWKLL